MPAEFRPSYVPPAPLVRGLGFLPSLLALATVVLWFSGHHRFSLNLIMPTIYMLVLQRAIRQPKAARFRLDEQGLQVLGAPLGSSDYQPLQTLAWADVASLNYVYANIFGWPTSPHAYIDAWLKDGKHVRLLAEGAARHFGWLPMEEGGADFVSSLSHYFGKAIQPATLPDKKTRPGRAMLVLGLSFVLMNAGLVIGVDADTAFVSPRWPLFLALLATLLVLWPLLYWQRHIARRDTVWLATLFAAAFFTLGGYFALMALPTALGQPQTVIFQVAPDGQWLHLQSSAPTLQYRLIGNNGRPMANPPATHSTTVYVLPFGLSAMPRRQTVAGGEFVVD